MSNEMEMVHMIRLPTKPDYPAPDGSEIRLVSTIQGGRLAHCTLPIGSVSKAVCHRAVEEIWYFLEGEGEVGRPGPVLSRSA